MSEPIGGTEPKFLVTTSHADKRVSISVKNPHLVEIADLEVEIREGRVTVTAPSAKGGDERVLYLIWPI